MEEKEQMMIKRNTKKCNKPQNNKKKNMNN